MRHLACHYRRQGAALGPGLVRGGAPPVRSTGARAAAAAQTPGRGVARVRALLAGQAAPADRLAVAVAALA